MLQVGATGIEDEKEEEQQQQSQSLHTTNSTLKHIQ
jgi:hypothetical protein